MGQEIIPSWVSAAMDSACRPEDWQHLGDRYQSSLETALAEDISHHPRFVERKMRGVYYTPEPLARQLVDSTLGPILDTACRKISGPGLEDEQLAQALNQVTSIRVLDPACGTGTFLVTACERLLQFYRWINQTMERVVVEPTSAFDQIVGVEIDHVAAEICRRRIHNMAADVRYGGPVEIVCADALRCDHLPDANMILTNPPFEVLTNFSSNPKAADTARWVRRSQRFPLSARGQINLYRLFLERCIQHLPPCGSLGIVLPLGFMGDLQGAPLRRLLLSQTRLESVTLISEQSRAFACAAQGVALLVARKGETTAHVAVEHYAGTGDGDTQGSHSAISIHMIKALSADLCVIPRCHPKLVSTLERLSRYPGLTGGTEAVASVHVGELDQTIHRRYISDQPTAWMLIRGEHMGERYSVSLEEEGRARYVDPAFVETGLTSRRKRADLETDRLVFQGIANLGLARRLRFALCPAGVVLGNSVNYLSLRDHEEEQVYYYLGLLNSRLLNWRFGATSYGNNVSNFEIGQLPIISYIEAGPVAEEIALIARQLARMAKTQQLKTLGAMELDRRLDRLIYGIYEITKAEQELIES